MRASALELQLAPESFDAVVALYVADHIERDCLPALFAAIRSWLRECGWLLITFETGDEPGTVGTWLGVPMLFSSYDAASWPESRKRHQRTPQTPGGPLWSPPRDERSAHERTSG